MTLQPGFIGTVIVLIAWALWLRWKLKRLETIIRLPKDHYASWVEVEQLKKKVLMLEMQQQDTKGVLDIMIRDTHIKFKAVNRRLVTVSQGMTRRRGDF